MSALSFPLHPLSTPLAESPDLSTSELRQISPFSHITNEVQRCRPSKRGREGIPESASSFSRKGRFRSLVLVYLMERTNSCAVTVTSEVCYKCVPRQGQVYRRQGATRSHHGASIPARRLIYSGLVLRPWACGDADFLVLSGVRASPQGIVALTGGVVTCLQSSEWSVPEGPVRPLDRRMGEPRCTLALSLRITNGHLYLWKIWGAGPRPDLVIWLPQTQIYIRIARYGMRHITCIKMLWVTLA